jgi:tRNA threonylcarbamoyladenosine modification (KEOPS) complex Cgi121 subunit
MLLIEKGAGSIATPSLWETAAILLLCFAVIVAVLLALRAFRHKRNARTLD